MILLSLFNLSNEANEKEIKKLFSCYGKIRSIKLTLGAPHSRRAGSGLIEMEGNDAKKIISALDGRLLWGSFLRVSEVQGTEMIQQGPPDDSVVPKQPTANTTNGHIRQPFRVASVEKVTDPAVGPEEDWYRYTIISGNSRITGLRRGTIAEVTEYALNSAEAFNLRNSLKGGRPFTWSSSHNKK